VTLTPRARAWLALVVPLGLAALAYARVLDGELQFDDLPGIVQNAALRDPGRLLGAPFLRAWLAGGRPLTDLTFALNVAVGGLTPWNFHLTSLLLHLAATALAFAAARALARLAGAPRADGVALAAAGIFALHPLQSQAVSYVVQRGEVLASALSLGALLLLLAAERRALRGTAWWAVGGAAVLLALGLAAKPVAVVAPALWLLSMAVLPGPTARTTLAGWPRRALAAVPLAAVAALFTRGAVDATAGSADAGLGLPGLGPWTYLLTQRRVVATYLRLALLPVGQSVDWDVPRSSGLLEPAGLTAGLLLLALLAGAVAMDWRGRRLDGPGAGAGRLAALGLLWFFVALAPTSSALPLVDLLMEHRCYLGLLGLALSAATLAERVLDRWPGPGAPAAAPAGVGIAWLALALALFARNAVWETRRALWTDAVAKGPALARPLVNLAQAVAQSGDAAGAVALARQARARLAPGDLDARLRVDEAEATFLLEAGRPAEVRALLSPVIAAGEPTARLLALQGAALAQSGDPSAGEALAQVAAQTAPDLGVAWLALGMSRLARGKACQAAGDFARAVQLDPALSGARRGLAAARAGCASRGPD